MIKLIGGVVFIIGGLFLGRSINKYYFEKTALWQEIMTFLSFCENEITQHGTEFDIICKKAREKKTKYSDMIADIIQYNTNGSEAGDVLRSLASDIKTISSDCHENVFDYYRKTVEKKIAESKVQAEKKGKTYLRLIPILFLGIVVILW